MKKLVSILCQLALLSCGFASVTQAQTQPELINNHITSAFVKQQVSQNMSLGHAIKSIIGHYPQDVDLIVDTALDLYPERYKEIVFSAVSAQPSSTQDIVKIAIDKGITECTEVVEVAIQAEPSYVDFVVTAAVHATPEELSDIVRVAVITEPDSADNIVQTLSRTYPDHMLEIMQTAIKAVPNAGEYVVDALLAIFPDNAAEVVTGAVRQASAEPAQVKKIIQTAWHAGVSDQDVTEYALKGGASQQLIAQALTTN